MCVCNIIKCNHPTKNIEYYILADNNYTINEYYCFHALFKGLVFYHDYLVRIEP